MQQNLLILSTSIYSVDFALQNKNLLAPIHQQPATMAFLNAITDALQDIRDTLFDDYRTGSTAADYNNGTAYVIYDRVKWTDMGVYELQVSGSTGVHPTGDALSATNWRKVIDNYIGCDERGAYTAQTILVCYAINKWFGVTSNPYIYITNNLTPAVSFDINIPTAVYTALGSSNTNRDSRIGQFISRFVAAGVTYQIVTY